MKTKPVNIGTIGNYYGGLVVKQKDGRFFWSIHCVLSDDWEEIPTSLYQELVRFQESAKEAPDA